MFYPMDSQDGMPPVSDCQGVYLNGSQGGNQGGGQQRIQKKDEESPFNVRVPPGLPEFLRQGASPQNGQDGPFAQVDTIDDIWQVSQVTDNIFPSGMTDILDSMNKMSIEDLGDFPPPPHRIGIQEEGDLTEEEMRAMFLPPGVKRDSLMDRSKHAEAMEKRVDSNQNKQSYSYLEARNKMGPRADGTGDHKNVWKEDLVEGKLGHKTEQMKPFEEEMRMLNSNVTDMSLDEMINDAQKSQFQAPNKFLNSAVSSQPLKESQIKEYLINNPLEYTLSKQNLPQIPTSQNMHALLSDDMHISGNLEEKNDNNNINNSNNSSDNIPNIPQSTAQNYQQQYNNSDMYINNNNNNNNNINTINGKNNITYTSGFPQEFCQGDQYFQQFQVYNGNNVSSPLPPTYLVPLNLSKNSYQKDIDNNNFGYKQQRQYKNYKNGAYSSYNLNNSNNNINYNTSAINSNFGYNNNNNNNTFSNHGNHKYYDQQIQYQNFPNYVASGNAPAFAVQNSQAQIFEQQQKFYNLGWNVQQSFQQNYENNDNFAVRRMVVTGDPSNLQRCTKLRNVENNSLTSGDV